MGPMTKKDLLWRSPLFDPSGIAEDARLFIRGLAAADYPLSLKPVLWSETNLRLPEEQQNLFTTLAKREVKKPYIYLNQLFPNQFAKDDHADAHIGRVLFESDRFPEEWRETLLEQDQIWVASSFNRDTFSSHGIPEEKIRILPNAYDDTIYQPDGDKFQLPAERSFIFLSVFDYNPRKGLDVLIKSWGETFSKADDVCLVLKTYSSAGLSPEKVEEDLFQYIDYLGYQPEEMAPIILLHPIMTAPQLASLYRSADCFVLPSHGEGWGRTLTEAMACGTPVITSRWSAPLDFCNDENSYLIDGNVVPVPEVAARYNQNFAGHHWFHPNSTHLNEVMKQVVSDQDAAKAKASIAQQQIASQFNIQTIAKQLISLLEAI